ncbi:unnamed protein product [Leptidea sinapis]|uniref:Uncharacterized protein n=1 Tax=Leptidea sinapis TaxID=189913 RepID=A0A5E4R1S8_9NEOP|nr:unnamed protein product [Leptidea sinapis]
MNAGPLRVLKPRRLQDTPRPATPVVEEMFEGRTRAAELTEELKTTHGLQKEDRVRIEKEETKARDFNALRTEAEQKAIRDKSMREAAEAGRRQREVQRRREHDEMFKQVLGITQETVDAYLSEILQQGVELAAEEQAFLLPEAHKAASRHRLAAVQHARMDAARSSIFGLVDDAEIKDERCIQCGELIGLSCRCEVCPLKQDPVMTSSRDDPRWKKIRAQPRIEKTREERIPPAHDIRCWLNDLIGDGPKELPSEIRRKAQEAAFLADPTCYCEEKSELRNLDLTTEPSLIEETIEEEEELP